MLSKKISIYAGIFLVVFAAVGFIALNMDNTRFLGGASESSTIEDSPVFFQQTTPVSGLTGGLTFNQAKLSNQLTGLLSQTFPVSAPRIETHILLDRIIYNAGDLIFFSVLVNDPFTKFPLSVSLSSPDLANYLVMIDIYDNDGILVWQDQGYALDTSADFFTQLPPYGLTTGVYTVRAYGTNVSPSYRQFRVLGDIDEIQSDFIANARLDRDTYIAGQNVSITISIPLTGNPVFQQNSIQKFNLSYSYEVEFENLVTIRGRGSIVSSSSSPQVTVFFTIPRNTRIRQNVIFVKVLALQYFDYGYGGGYPIGVSTVRTQAAPAADAAAKSVLAGQEDKKLTLAHKAQGRRPPKSANKLGNGIDLLGSFAESNDSAIPIDYCPYPVPYTGDKLSYPYPCGPATFTSSFEVPLRIRSTNITTFFWTESSSAILTNVTHKVYYYSYFGEPEEAFSQRSYLYPFATNYSLVINTTSFANLNTSIRTINAPVYSGVGAFNLSTRAGRVLAYLEFKHPDTGLTIQRFVNTNIIAQASQGSPSEVYFGLRQTQVRNTDNITVGYQTNNLVSNRTVYLLTVVHKDKMIYSNVFNFQPSTNGTISIPPSQLSSCPNGCVQQVVLYQVTSNYTTYLNNPNSTDAQQSQATVNSWLLLKGSQAVFRQSIQSSLTVAVTTDKTSYAPSDLVNFKISVTNSGVAVTDPTYINLIVRDEQSNQGLTYQDAQTNIQGRLIESEFLVAGLPIYDFTALITPIKSSVPAFDAYLASQLVRVQYSDIHGLTQLKQIDESALMGDIFSLQRYFSYSLGLKPSLSYKKRPFSRYASINNLPLLGIGARDVPASYQYFNYQYLQISDPALYLHQFDNYEEDFSQTVAFISGLKIVNGTYAGQFFLNDFQTNYSIYAEAYNLRGQSGFQTTRTALNSFKNNPSYQSLQADPINLNSFFVSGDSVFVQSKFVNNFNFPLNVSTFAYIDYGRNALSFKTFFYTLAANSSVMINATITAIDDTKGEYLHFNLLAIASNSALNITLYEGQSYFLQVVPNAVYLPTFSSGVIGTNFTGRGASRSANQNIVLPNANYFDNSFGMAQVFGLNEDILLLLNQAQLYKSYYMPGRFFSDAAATLYISAITYYMILGYPQVPQDYLYELQYVLYSGIVYYFPQYQNPDGGFKQFGTQSSELLSAQALLYLNIINETAPDVFRVNDYYYYDYYSNSSFNASSTPNMFDNLTSYISKLRQPSGQYKISSTSATDTSLPTSPLLIQAYITYALSTTTWASKRNFTAELNYLESMINATLTSNTANRTSDPLILALASVAFTYFGRQSTAIRFATYLAQYQAADGSFSLSTSYALAGQSLFGSSRRDRQVELTSYAAQALILVGFAKNVGLAQDFLSTKLTGGFFGGNQATIAAASTLITQLQSYRAPTDESRFGITLNNVLVSKSFPYKPMSPNIITLSTQDGPNFEGLTPQLSQQAGLNPGAQVNASISILGYKQESTVDAEFGYWLASYLLDGSVSPTSPNSPLSLNVSSSYAAGLLGTAANQGKNVTYTITVKNVGTTPLSTIDIVFRVPTCLTGDPNANMALVSQVASIDFDPSTGEVYIWLSGLLAGASKTLTLNLQQFLVGVCKPRQVTAEVDGDTSTRVTVRYSQ